MAEHSINGQMWPDGTVVAVYLASALPASADAPTGVAVASAAVSGGTVEFSGLAEKVPYLAYANGRGSRFLIPERRIDSIRGRLEELEGDVGTRVIREINAYEPEPPYVAVMANGVTDDTVAINSLLDRHREQRIVFPPINAADDQAVVRTTGTLWSWDGTKVETWGVLWRPEGLADHAWKFGDAPFTPAAPRPLTVDAVEGATVVRVSVADAAAFTAGAMVRVDDQRLLGGQKLYHEPNYVEAVNGATGDLTLRYPLINSHAVADTAAIAPIAPTRGKWIEVNGGAWDMDGVADGGGVGPDRGVFAMYATEHCYVRNVDVFNHVYKLGQQQDCIDSHFVSCRASKPKADGAGQGYCLTLNGRHNTASYCYGFNVRHTVDIAGGADNEASYCFASGRTPSGGAQTAFLLHGTVTKRCKFDHCYASNTKFGFGAGNSTFGVDEDFEWTSCVADGCEEGFFVSQACSGWKITGAAYNCTSRGLSTDDLCDGELDLLLDGCGTAGSGLGSAHLDDSTIRGKLKIRNAKDRALSLTTFVDVDLLLDIDHPAGAPVGAVVASPTAASSIRLRGGVKVNNVAHDAVSIAAPAGAVVRVDCELNGNGLRGVRLTGTATDQVVKGLVRGAFTDQVRAEAGELVVDDIQFAPTGNCVSCVTAVAKVTLGPGVRWNGTANTRLNNPAAAAVIGGENIQNGNAASQGYGDANATITPRANPRHILASTALTADRTITFSPTDAHPGVRFRVSRTGGGAFNLILGATGKSLATNQWADVMVDTSGAYKVTAAGSL